MSAHSPLAHPQRESNNEYGVITTLEKFYAEQDKENTPANAPKSTTVGTKRKSDTSVDDKNDKLFPKDVPRISEDDPRLYEISPNADTIRNKIRIWIDSGAQKVCDFQDTIGVSPTAYSAFMRGHGPRGGIQSRTYEAAGMFFRERQLQGLPQKLPASSSKKAKTADKAKAQALLEVPADVTLPGEKEGNVPVYETCDSIRRQVRALLKKDGITQAAYLRAIAKWIPGEPKIQPRALRDFWACRRVKEGKPKSKFRQEMEEVHGDKGMDVEHDPRTSRLLLHVSQSCSRDKYGKLHITPVRR